MKKDKKKSVFAMAVQNLKAQKFRTGFMIFFVMLMSATFLISTLLMNNLELGIKNTTERMGADMIVVPEEGTEEIRNSLFAGRPCSLFFDKKMEGKIKGLPGIKKASPQLYIATLSASCCDAAVQLIAFEPETDFVVKPWLQDMKNFSLKEGEIVIGSGVQSEVGDTMKFYETDFKVAAKLEETGMGYDNSVFMTFDTAYKLCNSEVAKANMPTEQMREKISMLMIDVEDDVEGVKLVSLQEKIKKASPDTEKLKGYTADDLVSGIAVQVKRLSGYGGFLTGIMVFAVALALISIFFITINERKYEFGILYTLGAKKRQITSIILSEALVISTTGGILGTAIAWYGVYIFKEMISIKLDIPYLDISLSQTMPVAVMGILIAIITGIAAAVIAAYTITKGEAYRLIRESE